MITLDLSDAEINIIKKTPQGALVVDLCIQKVPVARYTTADQSGVSRIRFTPGKEPVFLAWANKHKIASHMLKHGWKELYPTSPKVPVHALLLFTAEHLISQQFRQAEIEKLLRQHHDDLVFGNHTLINIISGFTHSESPQTFSTREIRRLQRKYTKVANSLPEGHWIMTPARLLVDRGIDVMPDKHIPATTDSVLRAG